MIRNITFASSAPEESQAPAPAPEQTILRLRQVTLSPAEEYQVRSGEVRPISDELAAAILSFKGRAIIGNKGVVVERKDIGGRFVYFHEHSVILNDFSARERRLYYVINRQAPDILHLLDESGAYLESLPLRERPAVLDNEAQQQQLRENKAVLNRAASRLQTLHADDTREALAALAENSREMQRVVQTLPAPVAEPVQPSRSTHGERAQEAILDIRRGTYDRTPAAAVDRDRGTADILSRRGKETECPF
jgi:hypothetical protein